jgi:hypothetical protein
MRLPEMGAREPERGAAATLTLQKREGAIAVHVRSWPLAAAASYHE